MSTDQTPLRLTRRGRTALLLLAITVLFIAFSIGRVSSNASTDHTPAAPLQVVTVHSGQTLWDIAVAAAPHSDPRATIQAIRQLNDLRSSDVQVGQRLTLPRG